MENRATRRAFLGASALAGTAALGFGGRTPAIASMAIQDDNAEEGQASTPTWTFTVHRFRDPYERDILQPAEPEPGTRYVGADVEINNESDAALNFIPQAIRLRDADGVEYTAGSVIGDDPRILDVNLIPGERARGWVWFSIPEEAEVVELVYVAPAPRIAVPVSGGSESGDEATPIPGG